LTLYVRFAGCLHILAKLVDFLFWLWCLVCIDVYGGWQDAYNYYARYTGCVLAGSAGYPGLLFMLAVLAGCFTTLALLPGWFTMFAMRAK
jgi:hypothetical protein